MFSLTKNALINTCMFSGIYKDAYSRGTTLVGALIFYGFASGTAHRSQLSIG